ncbi:MULTISPECIES: hypothetical protein [Streptomyces]|uniref:hypothetical protein n=1 Tax=Streptomyces TaxID=1883 RepID=UPI0011605C6B|nr:MULTISPECIES: hypothetical protein [Streptomyces]
MTASLEPTQGYGSGRIRARVLTTLGFEVTTTKTVSAASGCARSPPGSRASRRGASPASRSPTAATTPGAPPGVVANGSA